ncbi:MAG: acyl-CoA thioesterase [Mycobacteriales bacterium]|nr:thioesterase family protein [Frankia sp.]
MTEPARDELAGDTEFDRGTALVRTADNTFRGAIDAGWYIVGSANGGYVASVVLRALVDTIADPERPVRSLTVHYLRPAVAGPVEIETTVERAGRSLSTASARATQDGRPIAVALAAFATARPAPLEFEDTAPPDISEPADTPEYPGAPQDPPIVGRMAYRHHYLADLFSGAEHAAFEAWMRLRQPRPVDAVLLATLADAAVPAIFLRATAPLIATTVDLTVHFRQPPGPGYDGWCLGRFRSQLARDGLVEEDGEIYDEQRRLLAQSRQLAIMVPMG